MNFSAQEAKNERNYLHLKLNNNVIFKVSRVQALASIRIFISSWLAVVSIFLINHTLLCF